MLKGDASKYLVLICGVPKRPEKAKYARHVYAQRAVCSQIIFLLGGKFYTPDPYRGRWGTLIIKKYYLLNYPFNSVFPLFPAAHLY